MPDPGNTQNQGQEQAFIGQRGVQRQQAWKEIHQLQLIGRNAQHRVSLSGHIRLHDGACRECKARPPYRARPFARSLNSL